jgi:hypothetical protein
VQPIRWWCSGILVVVGGWRRRMPSLLRRHQARSDLTKTPVTQVLFTFFHFKDVIFITLVGENSLSWPSQIFHVHFPIIPDKTIVIPNILPYLRAYITSTRDSIVTMIGPTGCTGSHDRPPIVRP